MLVDTQSETVYDPVVIYVDNGDELLSLWKAKLEKLKLEDELCDQYVNLWKEN